MATTITTRKERPSGRKQQAGGFTMIEVVISMALLTVGLVSLLGVFGLAMAATQTSQQDMIAKQLANEALESIVTARNTSQLQWDAVQNVSNNGIFVDGYQPVNMAGGDGIVGTVDDATAGAQTLIEPGPDGIYGTSDDVQLPLNGYQRQVTISSVLDVNANVVPTLRAINVSIRYTTPRLGTAKTYVLSSFISQYR